MSQLTGIVNYGIAGNIHSIKKAVEQAGGNVLLIENPEDFKCVERVIIPGVGSFKDGMYELQKDGLIEAITMFEKPILGICLGMQVLATLGFEYGKTEGLAMIDAEVKKMVCDGRIPHMGFNTIHVVRNNPLLQGLEKESFYFMHSYEVVNYTDIAALSEYAGHTFVSSIQKENVYGVQFHPEKSREAGIRLFQNFIGL